MTRTLITTALLLTFATPALAQTRAETELIYAEDNMSIDQRVEHMKTHDMACGSVKERAAQLCRPYDWTVRSFNSDSERILRDGRKLLALESMADERAKTCGMPREEIWTPKCDEARAGLVTVWRDVLDTYVSGNALVAIMEVDRNIKKNDMRMGATMANTFMKDAFNWLAFNDQLGIEHEGYASHIKELTARWKKLNKAEQKRIAKNRCPAAKRKDTRASKQILSSAKAYYADQNSTNQKFEVLAIRLQDPVFTSRADDGSGHQTMEVASCVKITMPHRTRCIINGVTAKRTKDAGSEGWSTWNYHFHRFEKDFPCSKFK